MMVAVLLLTMAAKGESKMPMLSWAGKAKVVNHHNDVPFRVLERKWAFGDGASTNGENMVIHGDNLAALKALLLQYEGKVKCIYIDPPYNTGNEGWVYNDNVNDPQIKKWLGEVVGKEGEDFSRHDKWLCMMYPRLRLSQKLLSNDGAIFISIDENELYHLKLICDEIFGSNNFVGQWSWFKSATPPNLSYKIKRNLEYVLCYEKCKSNQKYRGVQKISKSDDPITKPQNTFKTLTFPPGSINFKGTKDCVIMAGVYGTAKFPNKLLNDVEVKNGQNANAATFENRFIWLQNKLEDELLKGTVINCSKQLVLSYKKSSYDPEVPPSLIDESVCVKTTEEAGKELALIFDGETVFDYPKPPSLIQYLLGFICDKESIVLDSFAGSGTTAHAVLKMNKEDGGNRKFILIEMMDYADKVTAERVKRVISGYGQGDKAVEGTGGGFGYYEVGEPLMIGANLNENLPIEKIREYVWYMETRGAGNVASVHSNVANGADPYLLGVADGTAYYFCYEKGSAVKLNRALLRKLKTKAERYVVYADICLLDDSELEKYNITFKKIPRDIAQL